MAGRPKAIIDWKKVNMYLQAGCTATSIAASLGITADTLYIACRRDHKQDFSAYSQEKRASGEDLLRMKQFEIAMRGDKQMLIWLGKNRLGQSDKQTTEISGKDGKDLFTEITVNIVKTQKD